MTKYSALEDKQIYYRFWKNQYSIRYDTANTDEYSSPIDSTQLLLDLSSNTDKNPKWISYKPICYDVDKYCALIDSDDTTITIKVHRDADSNLVSDLFNVYRHLSSGGSRDIGVKALHAFCDAALAVERRFMELNSESVFRSGQWGSRAVGLWLWDYAHSHREDKKEGTISAAIRSLKQQFGHKLGVLGCKDSDDNVLRRFHRNTSKCINQREVLSFK